MCPHQPWSSPAPRTSQSAWIPVVAVADLFPNGRAAVIEHAGHNPWVEQPAAFRDVVDPFLAQLE